MKHPILIISIILAFTVSIKVAIIFYAAILLISWVVVVILSTPATKPTKVTKYKQNETKYNSDGLAIINLDN